MALRLSPNMMIRMTFVEMFTAEKALYVCQTGPTLGSLLAKFRDQEIFLLHFNDEVRRASAEWDATLLLFLELLRSENQRKTMIAVDYDAAGQVLEKACISQYRNGRLQIGDLLEHRQVLSVNCVMQYDENALDSSRVGKPLQRRYNDATVEYVDHLIGGEKLKIKNGGRKDTLRMLREVQTRASPEGGGYHKGYEAW